MLIIDNCWQPAKDVQVLIISIYWIEWITPMHLVIYAKDKIQLHFAGRNCRSSVRKDWDVIVLYL